MKAIAWIISITDTVSVAVGEFELVHILPDNPVLFKVPYAPHYCQQVFIWQNKIIPLMNLPARFGYQETLESNAHIFIGIFAYRAEETGLIEYGAFSLNVTPRRYEVHDSQACPLPPNLNVWTDYIRCCFKETDTETGTEQIIPILKLERLFATQESVTS